MSYPAFQLSYPALLHELLDRAAAQHADAPAVGRGEDVKTYRQVASASRRIARQLAGYGVRRGDRVLIAAAPDIDVPSLLYGCSRIGGVFSVLSEQAPAAAYAHVLDDAEPALVVTDNPDAARLAAQRGIGCLRPAELDPAESDPAESDPAESDPAESDPAELDPADPVRDGDGALADAGQPAGGPIAVDPICLIYTSGSTGRPKAVVSTHAQLTFAAAAIQSQLSYRSDDVVFCPLPLSFDYGLYQIFLSTLAGARIQLATATEAGPQLLAELNRTGATVLPAVPGVARGLARLLSRPAAVAPRLRLLTNTGSNMPANVLQELRERVPGLHIQLMFGLTECKRTTIMPVDEDLRRPGSCGRALPGTEVFVIDADGQRLGPGEVGELVVRGPNVMSGYWRRPELTAQKFPRVDGLFPQLRTGDYGWLDGDGYLYFIGRRDDIYKERGFRVSATEVEAAANQVPGVEGAAVLLPTDGREEATLVVVTQLPPIEVLNQLRTLLDDFKVPRHCQVVAEIPVNRNGKIDRAELARMLTDGTHV